MNNHLVIYGCGGHARSVVDVVLANASYDSVCFVDDNAKEDETIFDIKVLRSWTGETTDHFIAIGDNKLRKIKHLELDENNLVSIISKTAHIGHRADIGKGVFIGNFCHIGPEAVIGKNSIINNGAVVEHEVRIGEHSHIGPNTTISGRCTIGELVFVGVGGTIKDYINICSNVTIGAGATVVNNITEPGVYVGTPARKIK
jgi:UDP-N-acetylbacillosamine N-acetyltransferase